MLVAWPSRFTCSMKSFAAIVPGGGCAGLPDCFEGSPASPAYPVRCPSGCPARPALRCHCGDGDQPGGHGAGAPAGLDARSIVRRRTLVVVLDGMQDPGNAGTIVRAAEAFGASGVIFEGHRESLQPKGAAGVGRLRLPRAAGVGLAWNRAAIEQRRLACTPTPGPGQGGHRVDLPTLRRHHRQRGSRRQR